MLMLVLKGKNDDFVIFVCVVSWVMLINFIYFCLNFKKKLRLENIYIWKNFNIIVLLISVSY